MSKFLSRLREWATYYEPATAKALVAAFFQILMVAGIALGDWPKIIDAVLAFVALAATVLAGRSIRNAVYSPATHEARVNQARLSRFFEGDRE